MKPFYLYAKWICNCLFHDCGQGSFFKSQRTHNILGVLCGILVFTPYCQWRFDHAIHHATAGDLDRCGTGDIVTLTVNEYLELSTWQRFKYRLYRSPSVLLGFGPWDTFLILQRLVSRMARWRNRLSVHDTNLVIVAIVLISWATIGLPAYVMIQPPVAFAGNMRRKLCFRISRTAASYACLAAILIAKQRLVSARSRSSVQARRSDICGILGSFLPHTVCAYFSTRATRSTISPSA